jgi:L-serine dehydratase
MNVTSLFDILGPVMIGPSSSHTAGAVRLGLLARAVLGRTPVSAKITLYGSFAQTGKGHGTDRAIVAGLLGLRPDDPNVRRAFELAQEQGLAYEISAESLMENMHPNTAKMEISAGNEPLTLWGSSLGAGQVRLWQIEDFRCELDGKSPALLIRHIDRPGLIGHVATVCGDLNFNISRFNSAREKPGGNALMTAILDQESTPELLDQIRKIENVREIRAVAALEPPRPEVQLVIPASLYEDDLAADEFFRQIIDLEAQTSCTVPQAVRQLLHQFLSDMIHALQEALKSDQLSVSALVGREHVAWGKYIGAGASLLGDLPGEIVRDALALAAFNAKMGRIVAAPTAGSSGILPAVILNIGEAQDSSADKMIGALAVAGMIGAMIARGASLSGAEAGCQAECGSAAAMAAGAVCFLKSHSSQTILNAAALALKNHLGLTCDPVAGLVEVPCVKRNAFCALSSVLAAELSAAGIGSVIPFRQVVEAMNQTGKMIPPALRESSEAGLAGTAAAKKIAGQK